MTKVQEWMKQVHPTTASVCIQDKMLDQEKEASITMTATPKRLQVLLSQQVEKTRKQ
jgi:hypothetical protein